MVLDALDCTELHLSHLQWREVCSCGMRDLPNDWLALHIQLLLLSHIPTGQQTLKVARAPSRNLIFICD